MKEPIFKKLWLYNDRANDSLLSSLEEQQQARPIPHKSLRLISHIMNTQMIWVARIKGIPAVAGVWDEHDLQTCSYMNRHASLLIKHEIDSRHGDMLQQTVKYTTTKGIPYEHPVGDILLHVFNHGTYHRGQIAQDLRLNGFDPINTDYITFLR